MSLQATKQLLKSDGGTRPYWYSDWYEKGRCEGWSKILLGTVSAVGILNAAYVRCKYAESEGFNKDLKQFVQIQKKFGSKFVPGRAFVELSGVELESRCLMWRLARRVVDLSKSVDPQEVRIRVEAAKELIREKMAEAGLNQVQQNSAVEDFQESTREPTVRSFVDSIQLEDLTGDVVGRFYQQAKDMVEAGIFPSTLEAITDLKDTFHSRLGVIGNQAVQEHIARLSHMSDEELEAATDKRIALESALFLGEPEKRPQDRARIRESIKAENQATIEFLSKIQARDYFTYLEDRENQLVEGMRTLDDEIDSAIDSALESRLDIKNARMIFFKASNIADYSAVYGGLEIDDAVDLLQIEASIGANEPGAVEQAQQQLEKEQTIGIQASNLLEKARVFLLMAEKLATINSFSESSAMLLPDEWLEIETMCTSYIQSAPAIKDEVWTWRLDRFRERTIDRADSLRRQAIIQRTPPQVTTPSPYRDEKLEDYSGREVS